MTSRRQFLRRSLALAAGSQAASMINRGRCRLWAGTEYSTRAIDLVRQATVIDMLGLITLDWAKWERWRRDPAAFTPADLQRLRDSGVTVFHVSVRLNTDSPWRATQNWLRGWNRFLGWHGEHFVTVRSLDQVGQVKATGKIGVMLGMQDSVHFRDTGDVARFRGLGQLVSQLTYNSANALGSGCWVGADEGLTPYGASVIAAMKQAGMLVDVSHCGPRTTMEALEAGGPHVLVTHSNCRTLVPPQPRCKYDDVIRATAAQGGVMGITAIRRFVRVDEPMTVEDVLDHFDYVARLVGVEHAGLGSDAAVDGTGGTLVHGLERSTRVYELAEGLIRRGYSNRDIEAVLGGNFLRVLARVAPTPELVPAPPRLPAENPLAGAGAAVS
ncbi:MAG: membrane dipeptidase [Bryobacterales bacterium]|nr:membrane dipeptidase [Bryobacterales bacterium]